MTTTGMTTTGMTTTGMTTTGMTMYHACVLSLTDQHGEQRGDCHVMTARDVLDTLDMLAPAAIPVWLDGGWGIDALVGYQTREHDDLDLVIALDKADAAREALAAGTFVLVTYALPTGAASMSTRSTSIARGAASKSCPTAARSGIHQRGLRGPAMWVVTACPASRRRCRTFATAAMSRMRRINTICASCARITRCPRRGPEHTAKSSYAVTTIEQIAREAGYAAPTIYAAFASKQGTLAALVEEASFGDAYEDIVQQEQRIADPAERLRSAARIARTVFEAKRAELDVLRGAGVVSPELAIKERERETRRFERQEHVVAFLAGTGRLKDGVDPKAARDILWALTSRDLFRLLVVVQGWRPDRYEDWLGALLVDQLLEPAPPA